jgi:hypothetical protein
MGLAIVTGIALIGLAGCAAGAPTGAASTRAASTGATSTAGTSCGRTTTAAGVSVTIKVAKGPVNCAAALRAEAGYTAAIKDGELQGNGGGAPVAVDGWTCESYPTPQAIQTGDASECHTAHAEVVAVLPASPTASSSDTAPAIA